MEAEAEAIGCDVMVAAVETTNEEECSSLLSFCVTKTSLLLMYVQYIHLECSPSPGLTWRTDDPSKTNALV